MPKRLLKLFISTFSGFLVLSCATDPGTGTQVAGSAITFTYANGRVNVVVNVEGSAITAAAVLFDFDPVSGQPGQAAQFEEGVNIVWPSGLTFTLPGCNTPPVFSSADTFYLYKIFHYEYPSSCIVAPSESVTADATFVINKTGFPSASVIGTSSFHMMFVTSTTYTGNLGGYTGADSICAARAAAGSKTNSMTGTWRAVLEGTNTRITFVTGSSIRNTQAQTVLTTATQLWNRGTLLTPIKYDENGQPVSEVTWADRTNGSGFDCNGWTDAITASSGYYGDPLSINSTWWNPIVVDPGDCNSLNHIYCINSNN